MTGKPPWVEEDPADGVMIVTLSSWKHFHNYVRKEMLNYSYYVWRGQRESQWGLDSALDRALRLKSKTEHPSLAFEHLEKFKMAVRGRRGSNPSRLEGDDEWWALAQHNGMATPLLDWTESPFVALYFAFEQEESPSSGFRSVWALGGIEGKNKIITAKHKEETAPEILEFIRPHQDDNARLVSQAGLFTKTPYGTTVETWVKQNFKSEKGVAPLIKITIPNKDRPECLRTLNKMNINHLSLFPDIFGAGQHCNRALKIDGY